MKTKVITDQIKEEKIEKIEFHSNGFVVITLVQITLFQLNFVLTQYS